MMNAAARPRRVYGGQSHEDRMAERRKAFVDAGFELIGTEGYRAATVRAVCKHAGYTDRYFYQLFGSTEGLLLAVYSQVSEQLKQALVTAMDGTDASIEARSEAGLRAFFRFMRDPRNARIMISEVLGVSDEITALYMRTVVEFAGLLMAATASLEPSLAEPNEDNAIFGQSLIGAVIYAAGAWAMGGYRQPEESVIAGCRSILIGALTQRLKEAP